MTRTAQLAKLIATIYSDHSDEIALLPRTGPRGGRNAAAIPGWDNLGVGVVTRACHLAGVVTLPYWTGCLATPSTATPACVSADLMAAYREIFCNSVVE